VECTRKRLPKSGFSGMLVTQDWNFLSPKVPKQWLDSDNLFLFSLPLPALFIPAYLFANILSVEVIFCFINPD
jgi:hypothetical protein